LETLEELVSSSDIEFRTGDAGRRVDMLLEPVARSSWWVRPIGFEPCAGCALWLPRTGSVQQTPDLGRSVVARCLLTQIAAIRTLARQGMDLVATRRWPVVGHSQESWPGGPESGGARDIELLAMAS